MIDDETENITCPYNVSHQILPHRMQTHLAKCRKNYPNERMENCMFNTCHQVPAAELSYHHSICRDREILDRVIHKEELPSVGATPGQDAFPVENISVDCSENWDDDQTVFYDSQKYCAENKIVRQLNCESKAKRRNHRMEERKRFSSLEEDQKNNEPIPHPCGVSFEQSKKWTPKVEPQIDEEDDETICSQYKHDLKVVGNVLSDMHLTQQVKLQEKENNYRLALAKGPKPNTTDSLTFARDNMSDDFPSLPTSSFARPPGVGIGKGRGRNVAKRN